MWQSQSSILMLHFKRYIPNCTALCNNSFHAINSFNRWLMDLEMIILGGTSQRKTNIIWYYLYVRLKKGHSFSSGHIWMWELDYKESWAPKNWCFWTAVLEKTLESPLDCKVIQPVRPKGDQSWVFTGRTDVEAETSILWPPDVRSWLIWKDPDAGKDWR